MGREVRPVALGWEPAKRARERYAIWVTFLDGSVEHYTYPDLTWMQKRAEFYRSQGCTVLTMVG